MTVRVFHSGPLTPDAQIVLDAEESHYLVRVRRGATGDLVEVLDGVSKRIGAEVLSADAASATLRLRVAVPVATARPLVLAVGMPHKPAMLETISRACEVGAQALVLLRCERGAPHSPTMDRINRVVRAAQRQCGRPDAPRIDGPISLEAWISGWAGAGLIADPRGSEDVFRAAGGPVGVLVGPEGGFTAHECTKATDAGFGRLPLGPFILRTEVAVVAAASRVLWDAE